MPHNKGKFMKKIFIGLLLATTATAFSVTEFKDPRFLDNEISARSDKDAVCEALTHVKGSKVITYVKESANSNTTVIIKKGSAKVRVKYLFGSIGKIISYIECSTTNDSINYTN